MNTGFRLLAPLALTAIVGTAAAQEHVTYDITWFEVLAGSNQPVSAPNGLIEPGEGVRVAIRATITPGIGSTAVYAPPPPGTGTIAGFGAMSIDIIVTAANGGTWNQFERDATANPGGIPGGGNWTLGDQGTGVANGNLIAAQAGQFILPGSTAQSNNPIDNIFRATWTPSSYVPRTGLFTIAGNGGHIGLHSSILIQYGVDPVTGHPRYVAKYVGATFGNSGEVPIVPAPGVAVPFAGFIAAAARCRRARDSLVSP